VLPRAVFCTPALVGLHPDEPTEDIVDAAWLLGKPCAVVPCCVFPSLFPHRRARAPAASAAACSDAEAGVLVAAAAAADSGALVVTYPQFMQYLEAKCDGQMQRAYLGMEGRNRVLFWMPPGPAASVGASYGVDVRSADDAGGVYDETSAC